MKGLICIQKRSTQKYWCVLSLILLLISFHANAQENTMQEIVENTGISATYDPFIILPLGRFINEGQFFVYNNVHNDGEILTNKENSLFSFNGNSKQYITGEGRTKIHNVLFENSSYPVPFIIGKEVTIKGKADFSDGIINYDKNGLLIFEELSSVGKVSSESFVLGKVRKKGKNSFTFPIGDNRTANYVYRKVTKLGSVSSNELVEAQYYWQNPGATYDLRSKSEKVEVIDNQEFWNIDNVGGSVLPNLIFYWDSQTTPSSILIPDFMERLTIVRWDGNQWKNEKIVNINSTTSSIEITPSGDGVFTFAILKKEFPDYVPKLFIEQVIVTQVEKNIDFVVGIYEVNGQDAYIGNPIEFRIPDSSMYKLTFNEGTINLNGHSVDNIEWVYKKEMGLHKFIYIGNEGIFKGGEVSKVGVSATIIPPTNSSGKIPLKVTVKGNSGGQVNRANDNDQKGIQYRLSNTRSFHQ